MMPSPHCNLARLQATADRAANIAKLPGLLETGSKTALKSPPSHGITFRQKGLDFGRKPSVSVAAIDGPLALPGFCPAGDAATAGLRW